MINFKKMKCLIISLAISPTIYATEVQIIAQENNLCLTFSSSETMGAYNPETGQTANYALATWETCVAFDSRQLFKYSLTRGTLSAQGMCLTPLPISDAFHPSLDSCETWSFLSGAGTYLFASECITLPAVPGYQQFTYDPTAKTLTSNCAHGLFLGAVGDNDNGFKAFFTDSVNTFPSAQILTGFDIPLSTYVSIPQPKNDAVIDILSEFLSSSDSFNVVQHGCWCTKISGFQPDYAGEHVDDIDRLCKEWSYKRRCNGMIGGSCPHGMPQAGYYDIDRTNGGNTYSCDTPTNLNDDCLRDSCLIDATYAVAIYDYLADAANSGWSKVTKSSSECSRLTLGDTTNTHNSDPNFFQTSKDKMCVGSAPDIEIEIL